MIRSTTEPGRWSLVEQQVAEWVLGLALPPVPAPKVVQWPAGLVCLELGPEPQDDTQDDTRDDGDDLSSTARLLGGVASARGAAEAEMIRAAALTVARTQEVLLARKDVSDPEELSATARRDWEAMVRRSVVVELEIGLGHGVGEARALFGIATAPQEVRDLVLGALERGEATWVMVKGFWTRTSTLTEEQRLLVAQGLFGDDPELAVEDRLTPSGELAGGPWPAALFWANLDREVLANESADAAAERARRRAQHAARRIAVRVHDDGTATITVTGPAVMICAAHQRIDRAARLLRRDGDVRTLDQLRHDLVIALLVHGSLPLPEDPDADLSPADLEALSTIINALPPINLQVITDADTLTGGAVPVCAGCGADLTNTASAAGATGSGGPAGSAGAPSTASSASTTSVSAEHQGELDLDLGEPHGGAPGDHPHDGPGEDLGDDSLDLPLDEDDDPWGQVSEYDDDLDPSWEGDTDDTPAWARGVKPQPQPEDAGSTDTSAGASTDPDGDANTNTNTNAVTDLSDDADASPAGDHGDFDEEDGHVPGEDSARSGSGLRPPPGRPRQRVRGSDRGAVAMVLGPSPFYISPGQVRELALLPGTTLHRLLTDLADGRLVERTQTTYRPDTAMRRQVIATDLLSRFPGSRILAANSELDHVIPWPVGTTCELNLAALDQGNHQTKTLKLLRVAINESRDLTFTTLLGQRASTRAHDYRQYLDRTTDAESRRDLANLLLYATLAADPAHNGKGHADREDSCLQLTHTDPVTRARRPGPGPDPRSPEQVVADHFDDSSRDADGGGSTTETDADGSTTGTTEPGARTTETGSHEGGAG